MEGNVIGNGEIRDFGITKQVFGNSKNTQATPTPAEAQNITSTNANNIQQEGLGNVSNVRLNQTPRNLVQARL